MTTHSPWLDAMRLLAALLVLGHHLVPYIPGHFGIPYAHLAVDFFFLISGLVVAHAYRERLISELSTSAFIKKRLIRLLPILFLAGLCSGVEVIARWKFGTSLSGIAPTEIALASAASFLALPVPVEPALGHGNWPLNPPLWSLFVEMLVGVFTAAWLMRSSQTCKIFVVALASGVLLYGGLTQNTLNQGVFITDAPIALARILWSFTAGLLIHSWTNSSQATTTRPKVLTWAHIGLVVTLLTCLMLETSVGMIEFLLVVAVGPLVIACIWRNTRQRAHAGLHLAGELSYALYALHWPLASLLRNGARKFDWMTQDSYASLALMGSAIIAISLLAVIFYERPLRRRLTSSGY